MPRPNAMANGKTVKRSGNMPDARLEKAEKIHDGKGRGGKMSRSAARVHRSIGGVVHATSHNYGMKGAKGRELRGADLGLEDED